MRTIRNIFILTFALSIVTFVTVFLSTAHAAGGDIKWTQTSNPSLNDDIVYAIAVDGTGVYAAGTDRAVTTQWRIEKRNLSTGVVSWTQISNPSFAGYDNAYAIAVDGTGVYVAGYDSVIDNAQWRIEKRTLSTGAIIWIQTINPSSWNDVVDRIAVDETGVYIAGFDSSQGGFDYQWRIEKRSLSTGMVIWTQTSNPSLSYDTANGIAVDGTGVYVTGYDKTLGNEQWRIEKRNLSTGVIIWTQTSNPSLETDIAGVIAIDASGVYVAGYDKISGNYQWRIEKRNLSNGSVIWTKTSNPSSGADTVRDIVVDNTGLYVAGHDNYYQWRIEKRNLSTGVIIWTQTSNPSSSNDVANEISVDSTGVYVAGYDNTPGDAQWRMEKRELASSICTGVVSISWTDPTITANTTKIRKVHIDEMRTQINNRRVNAGLTNYSWTDPIITANSTKIRKVHIDEMRTAISQVYTTCGQAAPSWTDSTITANTTKIRAVHINELRTAISNAL